MPLNILKELSILSDATNKFTHECKQENLRLPEWFDLIKQRALDIQSNEYSSSTSTIPNCLTFMRGAGSETKKIGTRVSKVLLLQGKDRLHGNSTHNRRTQRRTRTSNVTQASELQTSSKTPTELGFKSESSSVESIHTPSKKLKLNRTFRKSKSTDKISTPFQENASEARQSSGRLRSSGKPQPELSSITPKFTPVTPPTTPPNIKENNPVNKEPIRNEKPKKTPKTQKHPVAPKELKTEKKRKREEKFEKPKEPKGRCTKKQKFSNESTVEKTPKLIKDKDKTTDLPKEVLKHDCLLRDTEKKIELPNKDATNSRPLRTRNKVDKTEKTRLQKTRYEAKPKSSTKIIIERLPRRSRSSESKKEQTNTSSWKSGQDSTTQIKGKATRATTTRNVIKKTNKKRETDLNTTFISTAEKVVPKVEAKADLKKCNSKVTLQNILPSTPKMSEKIYSKDKKPPTPAILKQTSKLTNLTHSGSKTPVKPPRATNTITKQPLVKQPSASTSAVTKPPTSVTIVKLPPASTGAAAKQHPSSKSALAKPASNNAVSKPAPAKSTLSKPGPHTPAQQLVSKQGYVMTPDQASFVSYDVSEIRDSDDEDESQRGKRIPAWATGVRLRNALLHQHYHPMDTDELFGDVLPVDLEAIFMVKKPKYVKRTSSAIWNSPSSFTQGT